MKIRNKKTGQVFEVLPKVKFPEFLYEIVTDEPAEEKVVVQPTVEPKAPKKAVKKVSKAKTKKKGAK